MKKYIPLALAAGMVLSMSSLVLAAETAKSASSTEKRAEVKAKIEETKRTHVQEFMQRAADRLISILEKQAGVGAKIETRISKLRAEGKDVAKATVKLTEAHELWKAAARSVSALPALTETTLLEKNAKDARKILMDALKNAATEVRTAHLTMSDLITLLKAGLPTATGSAAATSSAPQQ